VPEPTILVAVLAAAWLYWRGTRTVWARTSRGRVVTTWNAASFAGGLLTILVALESPLDGLSADLFAAHMVQHLLLIMVAAPLLVLGEPLAPLLWALAKSTRRTFGAAIRRLAFLSRPGVAFGLHSVALWAWHIPVLYEAALGARGIHILEHLSFLGTAILFWWAVVVQASRLGHARGVVYVFGLAVESSVLGGALAFSPAPWYAAHLNSAPALGLSALDDQQLAGLIMWIPGGGIYLVAALGLFAAWLKHTPRPPARTPDREARAPARR
jgi:putative membrane protein